MSDDKPLFTRTTFGLVPDGDAARERPCLNCAAVMSIGRRGPKRWATTRFCSRKCRSQSLAASPAERFWSNVTAEPNSGCFLWVGGLDSNGYAPFTVFGVKTRAHRFSYEAFVGPIPDGMHILHSCDVPCCVNPAHLRAGTHQDNMRDMQERGRHVRGEKMANTHLTDDDVRSIRSSSATCKALAQRYGVGQMTISEIKRHLRWRHVS